MRVSKVSEVSKVVAARKRHHVSRIESKPRRGMGRACELGRCLIPDKSQRGNSNEANAHSGKVVRLDKNGIGEVVNDGRWKE